MTVQNIIKTMVCRKTFCSCSTVQTEFLLTKNLCTTFQNDNQLIIMLIRAILRTCRGNVVLGVSVSVNYWIEIVNEIILWGGQGRGTE